MPTTLAFQSTAFDVIERNSQPWIRGSQVASALGYPKPERVTELYTRHADEFTGSMTAVVTLPTPGGPQETRIFSLRGCHLLAMFARTPIAKAFRVWVLDVLETLSRVQQPSVPSPAPNIASPLTPEQQCTLQNIVKGKIDALPESQRHGGLYPQIWGRFKNHFRVAKYDQLPQSRMGEAISYLVAMEIRPLPSRPEPKALPEPPAPDEPLLAACASASRQLDSAAASIRQAAAALEPFFRPEEGIRLNAVSVIGAVWSMLLHTNSSLHDSSMLLFLARRGA